MNENIKHNNADLNNEFFSDKSKYIEQNKKLKKENKLPTKNNIYNLSNKKMNLKEKDLLNNGYKNKESINIPSLNINAFKQMISKKPYGETKNIDFNQNNKNIEDLNILKQYLDKSNLTNKKLKEEIKKLNKELSFYKNNIINSKLVNENNSNLNEMKINIGKLNDEIVQLKKTVENQNNIIAKIKNEKKILEEELIKTKKYITNKNDEVDNLNNKCRELILMNNELKNKNFVIEKEKLNEIKVFKEKIEELERNNKNENEEKNMLLMKIEKQSQQINTLEKNNNELNDKIKSYENNKNDKILLGSLNSINFSNVNDSINNFKEREVIIINSDLKNNEQKNKIFDSIEIEENNENNWQRPSTPSFKCPNSEDKASNSDLKNLNENDFNINQNEDIKLDDKNNDVNDMDNVNEGKYDLKYYKSKYMQYCKLYQEYKNKYELLEKSKNENEELNSKGNNTRINTNDNKLVSSLSSIKFNNQYNPNEYFILCDKKYKELKWYLLKKQSEYENDDAYDNLFWVASPDLTDINQFNEYSIDQEPDNAEMINIIKKLEEKENIISKLSYKLEKLERQFEQNKSMNSNADGENDKKKNKNKIFKYFDENSFNDNSGGTSSRKYSIKDKKNRKNSIKTEENECVVTLDKYNIILEKLNQTEAQFSKLQKENMELRKNKQFYLSQNNNIVNIIPNNDNDKEKSDNENNCIINFSSDINKLTLMGNNFINNINDDGLGLLKSTQKEENVNYKIKFINLEKKINLLKEQCKNILIKLKIPKKDREEIKRMLEYFDYTNDEILIILGDKKNKK